MPAAEHLAASQGTSLSALVEGALREMTGRSEGPVEPFADRWLGAFRPAEEDDPRLVALRRKYL